MELSIIIVSYNTSGLLRKCLTKVYKSLSFTKIEKVSEVIVVDNASNDDSVSMIQKNFRKVIVIKNQENLGFAKANNQGMKKASGEYILLLNSDTEIENGALENLLSIIKSDGSIGVVGGKLLNLDLSIQPSCGFFPSVAKIFYWMFFLDDLPFLDSFLKPYHMENKSFYEETQQVDWVSGACFMLRREIIKQIGFLDEKIFMYGEELEWCFRIKKAGYLIVYTQVARIVHHKGASTKKVEGGIIEEFQAILYIYKKHKSACQLALVRVFLMFGALLRILIFGIIGKYKTRRSLYAKVFKLVR